jgi:hypothetical protein
MRTTSWLAKERWTGGPWLWSALTLVALGTVPALGADRVVIAEEFTANS